jgi:REP element-mobilizing transposase RayT
MPKQEPIRAEPGSWHLLTMYTAGRQPYFSTPTLATTLQSVLNDARERHGLRVVAYCIMPTHFMWVVQVTEYALEVSALAQQRKGNRLANKPSERFIERMMSDFRGQATTALRATEPRLSHDLWMVNFFHQAADGPEHLARMIASVHAAPVRANLVNAPGDYAYSSYAHVVYGKPSLVKIDRVPRSTSPLTSPSQNG